MWLEFWYVLTLLGSSYLWIAISGALFVVFIILRQARPKSGRTRSLKKFLFILIPTLVITFLLVVSMKAAFDVERICMPCPGENCNPYCPEDASFPSGHAASIFAGFTPVYLLLGKRRFLALYIIPVLVGVSRLALGVHAWYDVLAGALIGIAVTLAVYRLDEKIFGEFK